MTHDESRTLEDVPTMVFLLHNIQGRLAGVHRACLNAQVKRHRNEELVDANVIHLAQPRHTGAMGRYAKIPRAWYALRPVLELAAIHEFSEVSSATHPQREYHDTFPMDFNVAHKSLPDTDEQILGYDTNTSGPVTQDRLQKMEDAAIRYVMDKYDFLKDEAQGDIDAYLRGLDPRRRISDTKVQ